MSHRGRAVGVQGYREREIFIDKQLVRVRLIIEMSRPALRHGSLNSLFQVALYLPSQTGVQECLAHKKPPPPPRTKVKP